MKRHSFYRSSSSLRAALILAACLPAAAQASVFQTVTNTADSGAGSLRAAINAANANTGTIINFSIGADCGPQVITLTTPLPDITQETHIEGYSQPGASPNDLVVGNDASICVVLDGSFHSISDGLTVPASAAGGVTISAIGLGFSGFTHAAINLRGGSGHVVAGIHIGGQVNGVTLDPVGYGIVLGPGVHGVTIGGDYTNYALRNIIGEALNDGIHIDGAGNSAGAAHDNAIIDNYIGIGYSGSQTSINRGNGANGIYVGGYNTDIERNYINFNATHGIRFTGADAHDNTVSDNFIGYQSGRTDAGNGVGVQVDNGAASNAIEFNSIWDNIGAGVQILDTSLGNAMFDNQFVDNGGLGIDLGGDGVSANDNDSLGGALPNRGLNFPLITGAIGGHHKGTLNGTLTSTPGTYTIEAYSSQACDASGYGEGEFSAGYMQFTIPNITVQGQGSIAFQLPLNGYFVSPFTTVTAIATDANGNTSEFSPCFTYFDDTIFAGNFETFP
ncbi:MAG TPA: right-handed parallel beta-helix repeat-containing protein [Rudaea sp.]|nr:right-handed parallel beta-helix repeat-containing protein [Rudaea sp.]